MSNWMWEKIKHALMHFAKLFINYFLNRKSDLSIINAVTCTTWLRTRLLYSKFVSSPSGLCFSTEFYACQYTIGNPSSFDFQRNELYFNYSLLQILSNLCAFDSAESNKSKKTKFIIIGKQTAFLLLVLITSKSMLYSLFWENIIPRCRIRSCRNLGNLLLMVVVLTQEEETALLFHSPW